MIIDYLSLNKRGWDEVRPNTLAELCYRVGGNFPSWRTS